MHVHTTDCRLKASLCSFTDFFNASFSLLRRSVSKVEVEVDTPNCFADIQIRISFALLSSSPSFQMCTTRRMTTAQATIRISHWKEVVTLWSSGMICRTILSSSIPRKVIVVQAKRKYELSGTCTYRKSYQVAFALAPLFTVTGKRIDAGGTRESKEDNGV